MSRHLWMIACLVLIGGPAAAQDQEPRQVPPTEPTSPQALVNLGGFSDDYLVGPGDLLDISVIGYEDLQETPRVSNSGEISLPMLGLVRVADLTTFEIEDEIARRLREADLVQRPDVLVAVQEFQAKPIFVMGAVLAPGSFMMSQAMTVMDALLLAGGLRFNAADEALLYRRGSSVGAAVSPIALAASPDQPRAGVEIVKVDLRPFKEGRFDEPAPLLKRGDVLVVRDQIVKQFFVAGDVLDPRNYLYSPGKTLMASQAISWAGGPKPTAKMSQGVLVRFDEKGTRTEKKVDWAAILEGRQPDFPIQPNDIIFVPGSAIKSITHGLLLLTDSMAGAAAFRIGRSYQLPDAPQNVQPPPQQQQ